MPKGIKKEKNVDKVVDIIEKENNIPNVGLDELSAKPTSATVEEQEYTVSPDGKYKFPIIKSDQHSDYLEERTKNIPTFDWTGHVVVWPHDVKATSIPTMVRKGYQFVPPHILEKYGASRKIPAGRTETGETAFYYPMYMIEADYKKMMAREEEERSAREEGMKIRPSDESQAIYGTEAMTFDRRMATTR